MLLNLVSHIFNNLSEVPFCPGSCHSCVHSRFYSSEIFWGENFLIVYSLFSFDRQILFWMLCSVLMYRKSWESCTVKRVHTTENARSIGSSYIRTAGQEALYVQFWILPLEDVDNTKGEGLGLWWGLGLGAPEGRQCPRPSESKEGSEALPSCPSVV